MAIFYLLSIVLLCITWILAFPREILNAVAELRRQFRRKVIQRTGNQAVQELARQLRAEARRMGIPTAIADQVIEEERQEIIDQLGSKYAREILDD